MHLQNWILKCTKNHSFIWIPQKDKIINARFIKSSTIALYSNEQTNMVMFMFFQLLLSRR